MILKIQSDMAGDSILIYNEDKSFTLVLGGSEAAEVYETYGLGPLEKIYVEGEIFDGVIALGNKIEETH